MSQNVTTKIFNIQGEKNQNFSRNKLYKSHEITIVTIYYIFQKKLALFHQGSILKSILLLEYHSHYCHILSCCHIVMYYCTLTLIHLSFVPSLHIVCEVCICIYSAFLTIFLLLYSCLQNHFGIFHLEHLISRYI